MSVSSFSFNNPRGYSALAVHADPGEEDFLFDILARILPLLHELDRRARRSNTPAREGER